MVSFPRHPHIPDEEFEFLRNMNALQLGPHGAKLLCKVFDTTVTPEDLALLKQLASAAE